MSMTTAISTGGESLSIKFLIWLVFSLSKFMKRHIKTLSKTPKADYGSIILPNL